MKHRLHIQQDGKMSILWLNGHPLASANVGSDACLYRIAWPITLALGCVLLVGNRGEDPHELPLSPQTIEHIE